MHPAEIVRLVLGDETLEKVRDPPARRSILAFTGSKRPGDERKKSAINEGIAIDKKQSRAVWTFHGVNIRRPRSVGAREVQLGRGVELRWVKPIYRCLRALSARNSDSLGRVSLHLPVSS